MKATQQKLAARRLYLEIVSVGGMLRTRPHPRKPGYQLGLFGMRTCDAPHARSLHERAKANQRALITLVRNGSEDPNSLAVLQEGTIS